MHFNIKHIFQGDSTDDIRNKINFNFDQILSFAVGPRGHIGPKGPTGFGGPSGKKGATGPTGTRATSWYKQGVQPGATLSNFYDKWVDTSTSSYLVYNYGTTGAWVYSGYNLFNSQYFQAYSPIYGPGGSVDKYAIGIKNGIGLLESKTNLVISDSTLPTSNANPNNSKVFVSTLDQTSRPIFTFSKTGAISSGVPSFYWRTTGNSTDLEFRSSGGLVISSLLTTTIDSYTAKSLLYGSSATFKAVKNVVVSGSGDFYLYSNTTIGSGSSFTISSSNLFLSSQVFISYDPIKISDTTPSSGFLYDSTKNLSGSTTSTTGIEIPITSSVNKSFSFQDLTGYPIFESRSKGNLNSGNLGQTIFGSTGGSSVGVTGGPFFYHVKKSAEIRKPLVTLSSVYFTAQPDNPSPSNSLLLSNVYNVMDLSDPTLWSNDIMVLTPTSYTYPDGNLFYIKIPSYYGSTLDGVYYPNTSNQYRIILNDIVGSSSPSIKGIIYDFYRWNTLYSNFTVNSFLHLNTSTTSCYLDIFYASKANSNNANPRVFWKSCDGDGGYMTLTNRWTVGSVVTSTSPGSGGIVITVPGGVGGGGIS